MSPHPLRRVGFVPFDPSRRNVLRAASSAALVMATGAARAPLAVPRSRHGSGSWIIAADQATRRVLLLDPTKAMTRSTPAPVWSWAPDESLADLRPDLTWQNVSEAKWCASPDGPTILACASEGLAVALSSPGGSVYWAASIPRANLHTMEWLPGGNIAVSASTAGWVRLYASALGPRSGLYTEYALPGAHGLYLDPRSGLLWAVGDTDIVTLSAAGGSPLAPQLTEIGRYPLPDTGGHDLAPVAGDPDRLWVTTNAHVHQFSIGDTAFVPYSEQSTVDRPQVKSIGDNPETGQVLLVSPSTDNPCTWCTSTIELVNPHGEETIQGSSLYKARWALL